MDQLADLILTPFRDIVGKGRTAVDVAGSGHPEMAKAAQSLIKEGGRALKRIEPQCQRHADEFGTSFVDAVKASDEIAVLRTELNDLLWEFDDYTELDHFDVSKYTELQQASRKAAPRIHDILMRMRIEPLVTRPISMYGGSSNDYGSMNAFPHLGVSTSNDEKDTNNSFIPSSHPHNTTTAHSHQRSAPSVSQLDAIGIHHQKPQGIAPNPQAIPQPQTSHPQLAPPAPLPPASAPAPPQPPLGNPWEISPKSAVGQVPGVEVVSPVPETSPLPAINTRSSSKDVPYHGSDIVASPESITCDGAISTDSASGAATHSWVKVPPSVIPKPQPTLSNPQSETLPDNHFSPAKLNFSNPNYHSPIGPSNTDSTQALFDDGLIVVEIGSPTQPSSSSALINPNVEACNPVRITSDSSFHIYKGFCKGAISVLDGEEGVIPVRKQTLTGPHVVARCTHYRGNFTLDGMGFRLRLLQKSHVATRRNDEQFYACLICVNLGHTVEGSDATIFFTQKDLFSHLSRHPRPFPTIDKLKIVQSQTIPEEFRNKYDLHVKSPQAVSLTVGEAEQISNRPTAICKENIKRIYGMRTLNDDTPVFEMAEGARIVSINFLDRYEGEWCIGYHDGLYASFPFDVVRLEQPPADQIQHKPTSTVQAVARWKFAPRSKGKNDWLKFDKGDVISNIAFASRNHWCWSGTNSKGKRGIFLASHIDPNSVAERAMTGDSPSAASSGKPPQTTVIRHLLHIMLKEKTDRTSKMPRAW
ncbi:hypothetical protein Cpir12675_001883 [Ceratocystis pirilliformis]|uniref:SH3 domain-containing protein n=1 Tax=Ceratocystis pirilliformis TaxID=259994 RepID=A0ABR3ZCJ8_9PEZI